MFQYLSGEFQRWVSLWGALDDQVRGSIILGIGAFLGFMFFLIALKNMRRSQSLPIQSTADHTKKDAITDREEIGVVDKKPTIKASPPSDNETQTSQSKKADGRLNAPDVGNFSLKPTTINPSNRHSNVKKRVAIFIDYSNFDKNWNDNAYRFMDGDRNNALLNWEILTKVILDALPLALGQGPHEIEYKYTKVQASVFPERFKAPRDYKLPKELAKKYYLYVKDPEDIRHKFDGREYIARHQDQHAIFLREALGRLPGYDVHISDRVVERDSAGTPVIATNRKGDPFIRSREKAVDARVISDLTIGAAKDAYDYAVLLASDTDYLPVIDDLQQHFHKEVIHLGFSKGGYQVRSACWGHIVLDKELITKLVLPNQKKPLSAISSALSELKNETSLKPVQKVVEMYQVQQQPEESSDPDVEDADQFALEHEISDVPEDIDKTLDENVSEKEAKLKLVD